MLFKAEKDNMKKIRFSSFQNFPLEDISFPLQGTDSKIVAPMTLRDSSG